MSGEPKALTPPPKAQRERPRGGVQAEEHAPAPPQALAAARRRPGALSDDELRRAVRLLPEEVQQFRELFQTAAGGQHAQLHGKLAVAFFSRSGLPHSTLKAVWEICDRDGKGHLTRSEFVLAARLVALAQVGVRPTLEQLFACKQRLPTPKFELPDNIYTDDFDVTDSERAIKHEYDVATAKWRRTLVNVIIERQAFAEGAMRAAYLMRDLSASGEESRYVAKISKVAGTPPSQYFDDVRMQSEAQKWARDFNGRGVPKAVEFIGAYVMELVDRGTRPICGVERYVPGQYVKYNNNWDWSDDRRNTPQAFSHFTWEASKHQLLICDIQGVADMYTDPQIHSISAQGYGQGNLGMRGITKFLESHTCNHICHFLQLPHKAGKFRNAGTVVPGARPPSNKDAGTNINSKALAPAKMEEVVQNLQLQWQQELIGLQQQAHNIAQVKLEAERRKMQEQQLVELKEQQRLLEIERNRLEEEKLRWLEAEKKKLGEQMEQRLERERRRLEQQALGQFVAAEGPLDRPAIGATTLGLAERAGPSGTMVASIGDAPVGNAAQGYVQQQEQQDEQQPAEDGDLTAGDGDWAELNALPQHWVSAPPLALPLPLLRPPPAGAGTKEVCQQAALWTNDLWRERSDGLRSDSTRRILQNMKSCGLLAPRSHEFPSPTAAGAPAAAPALPAAPPGGPPRILQPRECSCS